ncbi:MAG: hypothetical protein ACFB4I_20315 [Cyanophyceae cyanobacterium]
MEKISSWARKESYLPLGIILLILLVGFLLRIINLDSKIYWFDETFTSFVISGQRRAELASSISAATGINSAELFSFQQGSSSIFKTISSLSEDVHPPAFFLLGNFWIRIFGDSVYSLRFLSVFISFLTIAFGGLIIYQIFASFLATGIAITFLSLSPFQIGYAQEARPYTLLMLITSISTLLVLKISQNFKKNHLFHYTAITTFGLYTHILYVLVIFGQLFYLAKSESKSVFKKIMSAAKISFYLFIPWLLVIVFNLRRFLGQLRWTVESKPSQGKITKLIHSLASSFSYFSNTQDNHLFLVIQFSVVLIGLASIIYLLKARREYTLLVYVFLFSLLPITFVSSSVNPRFIAPALLMFNLLVASAIGELLSRKSDSKISKALSIVLLIFLVVVSSASSFSYLSASTAWTKGGIDSKAIASVINNQADRSLVISDGERPATPIYLLTLSRYLEPETTLIGLKKPYNLGLLKQYSSVFLYVEPRSELREKLSESYQVIEIGDPRFQLWKLKKAS